MFTLEAVRAKHGDALLLLHGDPKSPRLIMIDGGPSGVYGSARAAGPLRRRLLALKEAIARSRPLPIELLMVSHIDDDHIAGVLELTSELVTARDDSEVPDFDVRALWHNSFNDILGDEADELFRVVGGKARAVAEGEVEAPAGLPPEEAAVVAGVPQGRQLRDAAKVLGIPVNATAPLRGLVAAPDDGARPIALGDGLTLTVLGPKRARLEKLRAEWDKRVKQLRDAGKLDEASAAAFGDDRSVFNLSSIIVLAERAGQTMLLTGDGRGDHILDGLETAGKLAAGGRLHVNILKLPHHGSMRNITAEFFERITADHYVISANGRDDNPDEKTLQVLTAARKKAGAGSAEIHLTTLPAEQHPGKTAIADAIAFLNAHAAQGHYTLRLRPQDDLSVQIEL